MMLDVLEEIAACLGRDSARRIARLKSGEQLEARLGRAQGVLRGIINRAASDPRRLVLAEGEDRRTIRAARILSDDGVAFPILLGNRDRIREKAESEHISLDDIELEDPAEASPRREAHPRRLKQTFRSPARRSAAGTA